MLTTIDLNNQLRFQADEVNDELMDRPLAAETESRNLFVANSMPHFPFRVRCVASQCARVGDLPPHPRPAPLTGRAGRCIGQPFRGRDACVAKPPVHPPRGGGRSYLADVVTHFTNLPPFTR